MIWDSDNLNAPHTEREIAMIEQSAPRKMTLDEAWAQRMSHMRSFSGQQDEVIAHAMRNDAGWMAWQEVQRLRAKMSDTIAAINAEKAAWPHAGALHDGARWACDNIIAKLRGEG